MPPKKIPMRMCLGCREMKEKKQLVRVVCPPEGSESGICLDPKGKMNGRGAYVCMDKVCFERIKKSKALDRAFGKPVPAEVYEGLERALAEDSDWRQNGRN